MKLKPVVSAAACGLSLWSSDSNAAIVFEDHFHDGGVGTNTAPATGDWGISGYTAAMSESNSAVRWTAQGGWGWASASIASQDDYQWPVGAQKKSVEWKIGPMMVTKNGAQEWGDVRFQCGLFSAAVANKDNAQLWPFVPGCIAIEINLAAGATVAYANLQMKNAAAGADNNGVTLEGQTNHGIDPRLSHLLRLDLSETEVKYYVDNFLVGTALLADYGMELAPVDPETQTEFTDGFFINNWGGRLDDGEGLVSLQRVTITDSAQTVDIELPVEPDFPTPTLTLEKPASGLHILNDQSQYRRQALITTSNDNSWVNGTFPKTYSFTIKETPAVPNFDAIMYFSPYADYPGSAPDWSRANCAVLRLTYNGGNPEFSFAYKVNSPDSNGPAGNTYYDMDTVPSSGLGGKLASITDTSYIGQWSITFTSAENFTLTTPQMATASGSMLPATSAVFVNPMIVSCGTFNGADDATRANGANECLFSNITISGVPAPINESFTTPTLSPLLTNAGETNSANYIITPDTAFAVQRSGGTPWWMFQESSDLGLADPWEAVVTGVIDVAGKSLLPVTTSEVSANPKTFWRLQIDAPLAPQAP